MTGLFEKQTQASGRFANVALEQGIDTSTQGLTYAIPAGLDDLRAGERVLAPLGRGDRIVPGYVLSLSDRSNYPRVKMLVGRDPSGVGFTADLIDLARWMAGYYCCPLGMVLQSMLPAAVKKGTGRTMKMMVGFPVTPTAAPNAKDETEKAAKLTSLQQAVFDTAKSLGEKGELPMEIRMLADRSGARSISSVKQLIDKGMLVAHQQESVEASADPLLMGEAPPPEAVVNAHEIDAALADAPAAPEPVAASTRLTLNDDQARVVAALHAAVGKGFGVHLLHGVTGSGKTEVYLRAIEEVLRQATPDAEGNSPDWGVIVLVPEIALTPQTVRRFLERFTQIAVLHSGLTAAQRHEQWRRIAQGKARIVVGARSAVFAPLYMKNLGLIIVDEEHESSYKQAQLPRYHARDVAIKRAQLLGVPVILGSATPSLESYHNAHARKTYHLHELPRRVGSLVMPQVDIVDMQEERRKRAEYTGSMGVHLLSVRLENHIRQTIKTGGQTILLLNRRGYANYIACPDRNCGWMMNCDFCDTTMVYHKDLNLPLRGYLQCHHCTAEQILPKGCPQCGKKVTVFGLGTQRVEEEIGTKFPQARLLRMDSDVMRTAHDYHVGLERFRKREVDILVGTQMIAKGLDFPNVRLVGVISADTAINMPDFRASERTFQLIAQVAGRAGRDINGGEPSLVLIQTFNPEDAAIVSASKHDYVGFAQRELELRKAVGLPPVSRMARIVIRDRDLANCVAEARKLAQHLTTHRDAMQIAVKIRGPAPCPIGRIAEYYRQQVELIAADAGIIQRLLTALRNEKLLVSDSQMAVDVDPVTLL